MSPRSPADFWIIFGLLWFVVTLVLAATDRKRVWGYFRSFVLSLVVVITAAVVRLLQR